jgi:hypothetical protein
MTHGLQGSTEASPLQAVLEAEMDLRPASPWVVNPSAH